MPPNDQDIPRRISFVRLGLVILVIVGLGTLIWAVFFRSSPTGQGNVATNTPSTSQTTKPPAPKQTSSTPQKSSSNQSSSSNSGSSSTPQSTSSSNTGSSSSSTGSSSSSSQSTSQTPAPSSSSSSASSQQLANTGPGNTIALFAGVTAVAGIAHYLYTRKRLGSKL